MMIITAKMAERVPAFIRKWFLIPGSDVRLVRRIDGVFIMEPQSFIVSFERVYDFGKRVVSWCSAHAGRVLFSLIVLCLLPDFIGFMGSVDYHAIAVSLSEFTFQGAWRWFVHYVEGNVQSFGDWLLSL